MIIDESRDVSELQFGESRRHAPYFTYGIQIVHLYIVFI